ncbi:MAG: hydrogenase maturation protease [Nitrososphaerales archaeon]|jgi:hydrogenase maturation protease
MRLVVEGSRGPPSEDYRDRVERKGEGSTASSGDLSARLKECILGGSGTTHIFGIGNPIKQDDALGLEVVSSLRRRLRPASRKAVRVHGLSSNQERLISDLASKGERIVVIDAVEAQKKPGTIVCARLSETKFGFFATHNVPLRLIPGVAENAADTYVVGIQPEAVDVGEGLSDVAKRSTMELVTMIADLVEEAE